MDKNSYYNKRTLERSYGFDEISLVPDRVCVDPSDVDVSMKIGERNLDIPFFASAMDGVVDVHFSQKMSNLGGVAVLNSDGINFKYENPAEQIYRIIKMDISKVTHLLQNIYQEPFKLHLLKKRIDEMHAKSCLVAVSCTPKRAKEISMMAVELGIDILVIQATVTTIDYRSKKYPSIDFKEICERLLGKVPVIIGNCVSYGVAWDLMESGAVGILVGIGPGTACTTRGVLGIGMPQVSATIQCASARDDYFKKTGRYVQIITDGGIVNTGDACKAIACGADAVMLGSVFVQAKEAPGCGYHWGMAMPDRYLPRGTRIHVGVNSTLEQILFGPANVDDGTQNFVGALKVSMGCLGTSNIKEMHHVNITIAPSIKAEGKLYQKIQKIGMGK